MDATDLRFFEAVARTGGVSRAASQLDTVQSNVTARIRLLEGRLGVELFERHSRGVTLTAAGIRLLPYAGKMRTLLRDARRSIADDGEECGPLIVGSVPSMTVGRLAPALPDYVRLCPLVELELRTATTGELVADVLDHTLEGAFVCGPVVHASLQSEVVSNEELVLISAASEQEVDILLRRGEVRALVMHEGCSYRRRLDAILTRRGVVQIRHAEFDSLDAIAACVSAGLGVTLMPKSLVPFYQRTMDIAVHPLTAKEAAVEILFIRPNDAVPWRALDTLIQLVRTTPSNDIDGNAGHGEGQARVIPVSELKSTSALSAKRAGTSPKRPAGP